MIGQSLTNILQPASQQFASALSPKNIPLSPPKPFEKSSTNSNEIVSFSSSGSRQFKPLELPKTEMQQSLKQLNSIFNFGRLRPTNDEYLEPKLSSSSSNNFLQQTVSNGANNNQLPGVNQPAMNSILELANTFLGGGNNDGGSPRRQLAASSSSHYENEGSNGDNAVSRLFSMSGGTRSKNDGSYQMPTLRQFLPMAERNFGFQQGEGNYFIT